MRIVDVAPKDIYVTFEMSIREINMVLDALEHSKVIFDSEEEPELVESSNFLKNTFFKELDHISNDIGN
jgi:hypothetical protein